MLGFLSFTLLVRDKFNLFRCLGPFISHLVARFENLRQAHILPARAVFCKPCISKCLLDIVYPHGCDPSCEPFLCIHLLLPLQETLVLHSSSNYSTVFIFSQLTLCSIFVLLMQISCAAILFTLGGTSGTFLDGMCTNSKNVGSPQYIKS